MRYEFEGGGPRDGDVVAYPQGKAPSIVVADPGPVAIPEPPAPHRPVHLYRRIPYREVFAYAGMRVGYSSDFREA